MANQLCLPRSASSAIDLYILAPANEERRLTRFDGCISGSEISDGGPPYREDSWVPDGQGVQVVPPHGVAVAAQAHERQYVALISVPGGIVGALRSAIESVAMNRRPDEHGRILAYNRCSELVRYCEPLAGPLHQPRDLGVRSSAPKWATVTLDAGGERNGLHIDSWYGAGPDARALRPNRICINLGPGTRHFLFCPSVEKSSDIRDGGVNPASGGVQNVFSLEVAPNEAYIAPTEQILHDGSTLHSDRGSLSYTILGDWRLPESWMSSLVKGSSPGLPNIYWSRADSHAT